MAKIPSFNQPQLKQLGEVLAGALELHGGRGVLLRKVADGWAVSTTAETNELSLPRRTVALTGKPEALPLDDQPPPPEPPEEPLPPLVVKPLTLEAREVRYKSLPPLAPDTQQDAVVDHLAAHNVFPGYEFGSGPFRVYPALGWSVDDYEGFIVGSDGTLDRSQTYLFAWLENSIWILERPPAATGIRYGYVLGVVESKPEKARVQFIKSRIEIFGNVERELWSDDGESLIVSVPPQFLATDYNKLKATSLVSTTPILRFDKQGGKWRGTLEPRWAYKDRPPLGRLVRCST